MAEKLEWDEKASYHREERDMMYNLNMGITAHIFRQSFQEEICSVPLYLSTFAQRAKHCVKWVCMSDRQFHIYINGWT